MCIRDSADVVDGVTVNPIFANMNGTLVVNQSAITDELITWVKGQWGTSSVPVVVEVNTNKTLNKDPNWNNGEAVLVWVDLQELKDSEDVGLTLKETIGSRVKANLDVALKDTVGSVTAVAKAEATGDFANKDNINAMMTALWGTEITTVDGIEVKPLFSFENGKLLVDQSAITDGLLTWIKTQWGGSSLPVALTTAVDWPEDKNWNYAELGWIDLSALKAGDQTIAFENEVNGQKVAVTLTANVFATDGITGAFEDSSKVTISGETITVDTSTGNVQLTDDLTIPEGMTLKVTGNGAIEVAANDVTVKGEEGNKVEGSFFTSAENVTFEGLNITNTYQVGNTSATKNGLNIYADKVTVTNCTFEAADAAANYEPNGIVIFPKSKTAEFTITGNTFKGYDVVTDGDVYCSAGIFIAENYDMSLKPFFGDLGADTKSATLEDFVCLLYTSRCV